MPITKAIFCVAGFGTRFLPATKAQPKEMLPIVDKPIIQYLVEEAVQAGIQEIIFVTGRGKNSIENHFDTSFELETSLVEKGKHRLVEEVNKISKLANFAYVRQPVQKGDGHALLCAKPFIDPTETVLVIFPDYLMPAKNHTLSKMIDVYRTHRQPVIATDTVSMDKTHLYGVMGYEETDVENVVKIKKFVEKPKQGTAPSNLINAGYYIITPEVMNELTLAEGTTGDGEIRVADAFVTLTAKGLDVYGLKADQPGYDCGDKIGFLKATIDIALEREDLKDEFMEFLKIRVK
jgi:UTP--glucose-1-phosphate uridylyltransferase